MHTLVKEMFPCLLANVLPAIYLIEYNPGLITKYHVLPVLYCQVSALPRQSQSITFVSWNQVLLNNTPMSPASHLDQSTIDSLFTSMDISVLGPLSIENIA